jgi:peptidoglycan hydrolase-like protein with peptidoglycan-binding domain
MAQSGILALGVVLDAVPAQDVAYLQAGLIRLGGDPGKIDGVLGDRTKSALKNAGADMDNPAAWLDAQLRAKFAGEYA